MLAAESSAPSSSNVSENRPLASSRGRLVGWLISYEIDHLGVAFELRVGRAFLSSREIQGERSIRVQDRSVSSPHAVLNASTDHKVMIQDIFSPSGTFIKQSGAHQEVRIEGPTELKHGDWLRIGETRFQVSIIDDAGK